MKMLFIVLLLVSPVFAQEPQPVNWNELQKNVDNWIDGPVKLLITDEEKDVFKKLKTPAEKMQFIKIFWARRDPVLRTRANEFKEEFNRRVQYANENFREPGVAGWETARGQVYVLFGPPSREEKRLVTGYTSPALLWIYDKRPSRELATSEALMFVKPENRYILLPPNPEPGDVVGQRQREADLNFQSQRIPSAILQAFNDVAETSIIDEEKDYRKLLFSVETTEKFGVQGIVFEIKILQRAPLQVQAIMDPGEVPVYDDINRIFAQLVFKQELKKGDVVVSSNEHVGGLAWDAKAFEELERIQVTLPSLDAPAGTYELWVTAQDRISNVSETRKISVQIEGK